MTAGPTSATQGKNLIPARFVSSAPDFFTMSKQTLAVLMGIIGGLGGALSADLDAFIKARAEHGRRVRFDFPLSFARCMKGLLFGLLTGLGLGSAVGD
ncbi:MAG: hypothetical protein E6Q97_01165 [Desulfurellales bacterium]|nr:MAG: hypothetical protein E6Q97_01165 [Desulfurellales bacterium]